MTCGFLSHSFAFKNFSNWIWCNMLISVNDACVDIFCKFTNLWRHNMQLSVMLQNQFPFLQYFAAYSCLCLIWGSFCSKMSAVISPGEHVSINPLFVLVLVALLLGNFFFLLFPLLIFQFNLYGVGLFCLINACKFWLCA